MEVSAQTIQTVDQLELIVPDVIEFLKSIDCPTRLSELGIDDSLIPKNAHDTLRIIHEENGNLPGRPPMSKEDIVEVLQSL